MEIQLVDRSRELCDEWELKFEGCKDVVVHCGDFFSLKTDCIVSPANSFGYMDGGLDLAISNRLGWQTQRNLQKSIIENHNGELLVGQAELVRTENKEIPFCISAPTMRVPSILTNTVNVYLASKAIFRLLKTTKEIESVTIPGLATGVGKVPYDICAKQMRRAYDDVWLGQQTFPNSWYQAQKEHQLLYTNGEYRDLQFR